MLWVALRLPALPVVPLPLLISSRRIMVTSVRLLASVTVTLVGSRFASRHTIRVMVSSIVVLNSGRGTRHPTPTVSASSGSPVSALRSSPLMVTLSSGSQCRLSRACAQAVSVAVSSMLLSVSTFSITPYTFSFALR